MVALIPQSQRSPRVQALTRIQSPDNYLRAHLMCLLIPRVPSDHSIRLVPPNLLPIILPPLENPLTTLPRLAKSPVTLFLTLFPESPHNPAFKVVPPRPQVPCSYITTTLRFPGADITLPTSTMLRLLHPTCRNPNNPPPHLLSSMIPRRVYPEPTLGRRASTLLRSRLTKLV